MPKLAEELSALEIRRLEAPGLHAAGGVTGLYLRISKTGAKSWILRATIGGKRTDIGLGGYPTVTLAQARERGREAHDQIRQGINPIDQRKAARAALIAAQAKAMTFEEAMGKYLAQKTAEFKNPKHAAQWQSTLATYACPVLGKMEVSEIELPHIVKALEPIWLTKTETASRVRGRIEAVLAWATVSGFREGDNPARWRGNLDAVLPKPSKVAKEKHHAALPIDDMPEFMAALAKREGMAARALEFLILTAARSGEVRGAKPDEIQGDVWIVPAERMKAGKEHRVPLSPAALAVLEKLPKGSTYLFPAPRGGMLSDMSISAVCRRMKVEAVPHGFRSTFRDWIGERTEYPNEVAEKALAHTIRNKSEAAYRREDMLDRRRPLMNEWAAFCGGLS
ncbi:tyrosine-type recombinase/integrase [Halovulum sp. GXIMD14794]